MIERVSMKGKWRGVIFSVCQKRGRCTYVRERSTYILLASLQRAHVESFYFTLDVL